MKIGYVVSLFPCWSETFIANEIRELRRRGASIEIFSLRRPTERLVQDEVIPLLDRVHYPTFAASAAGFATYAGRHPLRLARVAALITVSMWRTPGMLVKTLAMLPRALGFLRTLVRLDIRRVHAHWATYPATACWLFHVFEGIEYSFTAHAHDIWLAKPLLPRKIEAARFVATISEYNRAYLVPFAGRFPEKLKVIRCGLDLGRFPWLVGGGEARRERSAVHRVVAVGRLDEIKGFPCLIDACRTLRDAGVPFACRIIGDGPLEPSLRRRIAAHRLEGVVELTGAMPHSRLLPEIREASVFVAPSVRSRSGNQDGIPVAIMEAMALGTPVIATRIAGIPELVRDGENGILVEAGDPRALAEAIRSVLDREDLEALTRSARATIEGRFNIEKSVGELLRELSSDDMGKSQQRARCS